MNYEKARGCRGPHPLLLKTRRGVLSTQCLFTKIVCPRRAWIKCMHSSCSRLRAALRSGLSAGVGHGPPQGADSNSAPRVRIPPQTVLNSSRDLPGTPTTGWASTGPRLPSHPHASCLQGPVGLRLQDTWAPLSVSTRQEEPVPRPGHSGRPCRGQRDVPPLLR